MCLIGIICFIGIFSHVISDEIDSNLLPNRTKCGQQAAERIIGGNLTEMTEFPWLALFEFETPAGDKFFDCHGALINNRYVITAAHCVTSPVLTATGIKVANVRLGEWDTRTNPDCNEVRQFEDCNEPHVDVAVEETIFHPDFKGRYNDIALLRLSQQVNFTDFIKPICLPLETELPIDGVYGWVAGWGSTEYDTSSPVKLKVRLPIVPDDECYEKYLKSRTTIKNTQLCAGGENKRDSCNGDSGGPLMQRAESGGGPWVIQGIVSFGKNECGTENWPAVYTRVAKYMDWIRDTIRP